MAEYRAYFLTDLFRDYYWVVIVLIVLLLVLVPLVLWIWRSCRHYARYDYTALEDEQSLQEKMEMERKVLRSQARESAFLTCQYYLKNSGRYVLMEQLGDIGSRLDKFWFLVRDGSTKTERLLTMIPQTANSPVNFSGSTKKILAELFLSLQHPYIYPVLDVDVKMLAEEEYVMVILPYNAKGSLKDIIYKSRCQEDWQDKYHHRSSGLPTGQVQRLGRQILEALLFLKERGFPPFCHLHSGNIIIQNGVSRLTGFENTLLGYTSRIYSIIKKKLKDDRDACDVICFGHVLFEMCAGYELSTPHPTSRHIEEIQQYPQVVEVLNYIFEQDDGHYPTIEEVSVLDFFRNMDLREMRSMPVPPVFQSQLSPAVCNLLKDVRRHQKFRRARLEIGRRGIDEAPVSADGVKVTCDDDSGSGIVEDDDENGDKAAADDSASSTSSHYFLRTLCSKRTRSSSLFDNHKRGTTTPSPGESKCGKLKKRRSNSIPTPADEAEGVTVSLLSRNSSESGQQTVASSCTPYSSFLEMPSYNALERGGGGDEFHTPPNTPMVSKSLLDDSTPFVAILTPSSSSHKLTAHDDVMNSSSSGALSRSASYDRGDPKV